MTAHSIAFGSFTVERHFPASPQRVFAAWADATIKARWFGGPNEGGTAARIFEFRAGGREFASGKAPNGETYTFDVHYYDIVPDTRIVYAYEMTMGGKRISVSLASIELRPEGDGTHMLVREDGAFLDGLDNLKQRQDGTEWLMNQLGTELARQ